jgi:galactose-1-phosphate uridylyltransferase
MNEFRLDPESLSFTLVTKEDPACKACIEKEKARESVPFKHGFARIYEIKDDVQTSKFELSGEIFKSSNAHGYEEIIVDDENHKDAFKTYIQDDIEKLLMILVEQTIYIEKYDLGQNLVIKREMNAHGYFDLLVLPVPKKESKTCFECESIKNTGNREVYKTEHFIIYVPFAPKYNFELIIAPKKHIPFSAADPVILFDMAGIIKRVVNSYNNINSWAIVQDANNHFKIKLFGKDVDPYEIAGVRKITTNPDVLAKTIRDDKKI